MGSFVYAGRCKAHGDRIGAMISLETIGYFSDAPDSQTYPSPGLGIFYPKVGNFIGFVANVHSRALLRRVLTNLVRNAIDAARPEVAIPLYETFINAVKALGVPVATGRFGADMQVELVNDGPVTIIVDTN